MSALRSERFESVVSAAKSHLYICHLRKATCGEHSHVNSHPFAYKKWLFAHNGSIDGEYLRTQLTGDHRNALIGQTDSEIYFHWLIQCIEEGGIGRLCEGIKSVREQAFTALNFLLSDGQKLIAYWEQSTTAEPSYPDYYQLWQAERCDENGCRGMIICSERLDDGDWMRIPEKVLTVISADLSSAQMAV